MNLPLTTKRFMHIASLQEMKTPRSVATIPRYALRATRETG